MTMIETETRAPKVQIATHLLLDASGAVTEDMEKAHSARYIDKATGGTIDYHPANEAAMLMLALFGAKTLMTNEASQVRNSKEGGDGAEQLGAIKDRLALIDSGTWVDRTRDVGARWDVPMLCSAMVQVLVDGKNIPDEEAARNDYHARLLQKCAEDEKFASGLRQVAGVEAAYKKLAGKPVKSAADILGALGSPAPAAS